MKSLILILLLGLIASCTNDETSEDASTKEQLSRILTGDFGSIRSLDSSIIDIDNKFNSWGSSGRSFKQMHLKVNGRYIGSEQADWVLTIRSNSGLVGSYGVDDVGINLFTNYSAMCCLNKTDLFENDEIYTDAFVAVAGTINFVSDNEGSFDLYFKKESPGRSGLTVGDTVNVLACWNIAGEFRESGCKL